jgi:DNA repair protein RadC
MAGGVVLFHTHPSGDPTPARGRAIHAPDGRSVGVEFVYHLVLGAARLWVSLYARGG